MKILMTQLLKDYINAYDSKRKFCYEFDIDPATLSRYMDNERGCSAYFVAKVKDRTGMDFEKTFKIEED